MIRFDAYSATTKDVRAPELLSLVQTAAQGATSVQAGRGFHSFGERVSVRDDTGAEVGAVSWGGRQGDRCMIEVKGESTPKAVEALRSRCWHRVTRVDACADFDAPDAWNRLLRAVLAVKRKHRLYGERRGDWDQPEKGRTMYLGATTSTTRLRLYEKGKQPEYAHLERTGWVRAEIQVRPAKDAKGAFASLSPLECWGASAWSRELAGKLLSDHVDPHPAGTVYRHTDRESALRWMCKQYGAHLVTLAQDLGSWDCVGLTLRELIEDQK